MSERRELYDQLSAAINSGQFSVFCTLRTPRPAPKGPPRWDPAEGQRRAEQIADSLAREGVSAIVCASFQSINTRRPTTPHYHAVLSREPSAAWCSRFRAQHGPRAVHMAEVGPRPQDAARIAWYIARQSVSVAVAAPTFTTSAQIADDEPPRPQIPRPSPPLASLLDDFGALPSTAQPPPPTATRLRRPVVPLRYPSPPPARNLSKTARPSRLPRPPPKARPPPRVGRHRPRLPPRPCTSNDKQTTTTEKRTNRTASPPPVDCGHTENRQSSRPSVRPSLCCPALYEKPTTHTTERSPGDVTKKVPRAVDSVFRF